MTDQMVHESDSLVISESAGACGDCEAYLFGDLGAEASRAFESHQQSCAACQKEVAEYRLFTAVWASPPPSITARVSEAEHQRIMESVFCAASMEKIADSPESIGKFAVLPESARSSIALSESARKSAALSENAGKSVVPSEKVRTFGLLGGWVDFSAILSVLSPRSLGWGGLIFAVVVGVIASIRFNRSKEAVVPSVSRSIYVSERAKPMNARSTVRQRKMAALQKRQTIEPETPSTWSPRESFAIVAQTTDPKQQKNQKTRQKDVFDIESLRVVVRIPKSSNVIVRTHPRESSQREDFVFAGDMVRIEQREPTSQSLGIDVRIEDDPHAFFQLRQAEMVAREAKKQRVSVKSINKNPEIPLIQRAIPRAIGEDTISPALLL